MNKICILIFLSAIVMQGCKKENKISKNLEGTWTITGLNTRKGSINDFSAETMTFQFFSYKNAYTRSMKGVYRIDYMDGTKQALLDTFVYQLKGRHLEITKVQAKKFTSNGIALNTFNFLRRRFLLSGSASNQLTLSRLDTTEFYIRAIKQ